MVYITEHFIYTVVVFFSYIFTVFCILHFMFYTETTNTDQQMLSIQGL